MKPKIEKGGNIYKIQFEEALKEAGADLQKEMYGTKKLEETPGTEIATESSVDTNKDVLEQEVAEFFSENDSENKKEINISEGKEIGKLKKTEKISSVDTDARKKREQVRDKKIEKIKEEIHQLPDTRIEQDTNPEKRVVKKNKPEVKIKTLEEIEKSKEEYFAWKEESNTLKEKLGFLLEKKLSNKKIEKLEDLTNNLLEHVSKYRRLAYFTGNENKKGFANGKLSLVERIESLKTYSELVERYKPELYQSVKEGNQDLFIGNRLSGKYARGGEIDTISSQKIEKAAQKYLREQFVLETKDSSTGIFDTNVFKQFSKGKFESRREKYDSIVYVSRVLAEFGAYIEDRPGKSVELDQSKIEFVRDALERKLLDLQDKIKEHEKSK
jgi:hypothetical protein